jgi:2-aminobenzoate-CoA ligase
MASHCYDSFVVDRLPPADELPEFRFDMPELHYPERLNAAVELLDRAVADGEGARVAVRNDLGEWTYAELKDLSDRIARLLVEEEGLIPGNRVLLRGPNSMFLFAAWFAVLKAGGVLVTTMPMLRGGEIATLLRRAEIHHAIVDQGCLEDFRAAECEAGALPSALVYAGGTGSGPLEERLTKVAGGFSAVDTGRDDPAMVAFTSGTTGKPKGCVQFHRDILAPADTFSRHILNPQPGDVHCGSPPIAFTFGLGALVMFPFRSRGTTVTVAQPGPAALLDAIERHKVTTLYTAPTAYKAMLGQLGGRDISTLKTCVAAGEHLPAVTWKAWHQATGLRIVDGIGATEMMHIFISASGEDIRPGATGMAVPGYTACVLDDAGEPLTSGIGRLAVKGPTGCRYFDDDRQSSYVQNGWNVTGDTYRLDENGYFWFIARSDDMIVSAGYNIAGPEVENALLSHPAVAECAVVGIPNVDRGMIVSAHIVPAEGQEPDGALVKALQDHVKAVIAPYKYPRVITFCEALPRTATGKLQRFMLRRAAQPDQAT